MTVTNNIRTDIWVKGRKWISDVSDEIPKRRMEVHYDKSWNLLCRALHRNFVVAGDQVMSGDDLCEQSAAFYVHPPSKFTKQSRIYVLPSPLAMQICLCVFMQTIRGSDIFLRFVYISTSVSWILCWRAVAYEYFFGSQFYNETIFYCFHDRSTQKYFLCLLIKSKTVVCGLAIVNSLFVWILGLSITTNML